MSPLTKLFVILLVVLSTLLTAGTVVFVSQTTNYKVAFDTAERKLRAAEGAKEQAVNDADAAKAQAQKTFADSQGLIEQAKQQLNQKDQSLVDRASQLADLSSKQTMLSADIARLTEALKSSEDTKSKLSEQLAGLRTGNDDYLKRNGELNLTVTDLTNKLTVTERERQWLAEQLAESKNQATKLGQSLLDAGINPTQVASAGVRGGAPAINGVIREVRPIEGKPYATISVGSNDNVVRGMEFKIVSKETRDFLGVLTVDSVEQNEATGRLQGPRVQDIRPGAEVRTQL